MTNKLLHPRESGGLNYNGRNLSGKSFQRMDLSGADFSGADIRGADFRNSILRGARFANAKAGTPQRTALSLYIGMLVGSGLLGLIAGFTGTLVNLALRSHTSQLEESMAGWAMLFLLIGFSVLSVQNGLVAGFAVFMVAFALATLFIMAGVLTGANSILMFFIVMGFIVLFVKLRLFSEIRTILTIALPVVVILFLAPVLNTVVSPNVFGIAFAIILALIIMSSVVFTTTSAMVIAVSAGVTFGDAAALLPTFLFVLVFGITVGMTGVISSVIPVVLCVMGLSGYLGWRGIRGDRRQVLIRRIITTLATLGSTRFNDADLTGADFTHATLTNVDFRGAVLSNIRWSEDIETEVDQAGRLGRIGTAHWF